ncbi:hypothetical protein NM961_05900 [Tahibacter sp. P2K]|uniref:Peptidase M61 catalytic domain-containing protein n=1 Tax=Tahibacter harae TaxID=2963937 RepID=A0ABT1QPN8_9GAMM|nr:hypothetical protein [Tahibacter harae]
MFGRCLGLMAILLTAPAQALLRYELDYHAAEERMQVRICSDTPRAQQDLRLHRGGAAYVGELRRAQGRVEKSGPARWRISDWRAGECVDYTADLGRLSRSGDRDIGSRAGGSLLLAPQQWLLAGADDEAAEVRLRLPPGQAFSPPWQRLEDDGSGVQRYRLPQTPFSWTALVALGSFEEITVKPAGSAVRVAILGDTTPAQRRVLRDWMRQSLDAASRGYGRLPLPFAQVVLLAAPGTGGRRGVGFGQSLRGQGNAVHLWVDPARSLQDLNADWTAVHEFSHWAHPYLADGGAWLAEGLASYWQNVLRARAGLLSAGQAWEQLLAGFERGRRTMPDQASLAELSEDMHARRAYYAVYWSGAAYWLQVDVELRRASGGRLSVDLALQRFAACCLQPRREWAPQAFVARLDALLGSDVFLPRWREYAARRGFPPLQALQDELGLELSADGKVQLREAPAAAVRDAIMRGEGDAGARR